ncbi:MAG: DNA primase [Lachnospiraceae bacterium]|nr:DNA primase [Lachnospiraceae bacterium]
MYYPDEIVEEVLRSNNIVDVVGEHVRLTKRGANHFGLCPFHNEKTGSFSVSERKQMFYCFGCHAGGNAATFLMKYENCSFQEALQQLADRAGIRLPQPQYSEEQERQQKQRARLFEVNKETAVYYYRLLRSPKGRRGWKYLTDRGLSPEIIGRFGLGYADGAGSDLVKHLRELHFTDEEILGAGVAAFDEKRGLHDKFWNRVMFPIQDLNRRVIGFGGRVMGDGKPKYLNSPETEIFNKRRNLYGLHLARRGRSGRFILCEGYMDVIAMHQAGFTEAVASLGTAFTEGQASLLKRYAPELLLAYDSDNAGIGAALRNIRILNDAGMTARVIHMEPCKDPDEFIKTLGVEAFAERIRDAQNSFFFSLDMAQRDYDLRDPAGRTRFQQETARRLTGFTDALERENYMHEAANRYHIPYEALRTEVGRYGLVASGTASSRSGTLPVQQEPERRDDAAGSPAAEIPAAQNSGPGGRRGGRRITVDAALRRDERLLLSALSEDSSLLAPLQAYLEPSDFSEGTARACAEAVWKKAGSPDASVSAASVIASFETEEEQEEAASLFSAVLPPDTDEKARARALRDAAVSVLSASVKRMRDDMSGGGLLRMAGRKKQLEKLMKKSSL